MTRSIRRLAVGSPVERPLGKVVLGATLAAAVLFSSPQSIAWATGYPIPMLVGMIVGLGFYLPTIIAIRFLDRREREPLLLMASAPWRSS